VVMLFINVSAVQQLHCFVEVAEPPEILAN
jgi:hypothetical protein